MSLSRYFVLLNFLICLVLGGVAFFYNTVQAIPLCPLCGLQALCFYLIGILSLIRFVFMPEKFGRYAYAVVVLLLSVIGILFASRQIWMQHLPNKTTLPCAPDLVNLVTGGSAHQLFSAFFQHYNNCALASWQVLGFSMPAWSLIFFAIIAISSFFLLCSAHKEKEMDVSKAFS